MIRRLGLLTLAIFLLLSLLSPSPASAQGGLKILDSWAEAKFPSILSFGLSVSSDVNITDVRLHYSVDRVSFAQVTSEVYIEFAPDTEVLAEWTWDMRKVGGLPPGTTISYWWTAKDESLNIVQTPPLELHFDDTRYSWRSLTEGKLTLYWYEGDEYFVQELMATAQDALSRLERDTGAHLRRPSRMYIYATAQELRGAMIYPQEWTGGVAFTSYGVIAIGIEPDNLSWGKKAMTHELTHLVVSQMTLNPYNDLPVWLDEGLAMYSEGVLGVQFATYLAMAVAEDSLFSVRSLASPFSAEAEKAVLSYAQSYSLVSFLVSSYGQEKILKLLNTFEQGSTYDGALEKVYGFDMDGLDSLWQEYLREQFQSASKEKASFEPTGALATLVLID